MNECHHGLTAATCSICQHYLAFAGDVLTDLEPFSRTGSVQRRLKLATWQRALPPADAAFSQWLVRRDLDLGLAVAKTRRRKARRKCASQGARPPPPPSRGA